MIGRQRFPVIAAVFYWTLLAHAQSGSGMVLVRNNSITTLNPISPPISSLVDPTTGALQGSQTLQNYKYVFYAEAFTVAGDGPLVLYQLSDPNQTLFLAKTAGQITLSSFVGQCRVVDSTGLALVIATLPTLQIEHDHAFQSYGIDTYPSATVCRDTSGIIGVTTTSVALVDRSVALLFLRDTLDVPSATIAVTHGNVLDLFDLNGGMRRDYTDRANPAYVPLDASGNPVLASSALQPSSTTCTQVVNTHNSCLANDPFWRNSTQGATQATLDLVCWDVATLEVCGVSLAILGASELFVDITSAGCQTQPSGGETCSDPPGASAQCTANAVCHVDSKNSSVYCTYPITGPNTCTPPNVCGGPPYCASGVCWTDPLPAGTSCTDDNNVCTDDICDGKHTCTHQNNRAVCRPSAGPCDVAENCANGSCPSDGFQPNGTACNDGSACTTNDACSGGTCAGTPVNCDDNNICTADSCNSASGCVNTPISGCIPGCVSPPSGLVGWWPGDGNANDIVGGNNGTLVNATTFGPGEVGQAFSLDGVNDYVNLGDVLNTLSVPFTIEAWVNRPGGLYEDIFASDGWGETGGAAYHGFLFRINSDSTIAIGYGDGGGADPSHRRSKGTVTTIPAGTWVHLATVVRGATDMSIYINGVDAGGSYSGTGGAMAHDATPARIGASTLDLPRYFKGSIDELSLYSRALTQAEIQAIVSAGSAGKCK